MKEGFGGNACDYDMEETDGAERGVSFDLYGVKTGQNRKGGAFLTTKHYFSTVEGEKKYREAVSLLHGGQAEQGYRMLFEASACGSEDAARMLGLAFVRRDGGEGRRYLQNAVESRDPRACAGICRLYDRGFPGISAETAEKCCRIAAEFGDDEMKRRLAQGFELGELHAVGIAFDGDFRAL